MGALTHGQALQERIILKMNRKEESPEGETYFNLSLEMPMRNTAIDIRISDNEWSRFIGRNFGFVDTLKVRDFDNPLPAKPAA